MFVFVILHYLSEEMTVECVEKLRTVFAEQAYHIVIVDNGSANQSGERLRERYQNTDKCTILLNSENLGFARGNNIGYAYAKHNLDADYIIVMNNDVLIEDNRFLDKIIALDRSTEFHILGPDIHAAKTGIHQNPMRRTGYTKSEVEKIISERRRWLALYPLHYSFRYAMQWLKQMIKKMIGRKEKPAEALNPLASEPTVMNPVLHGACYIFSRRFIDREDEAFDPATFLYFEEDILYYKSMKKGYRMVYDSSLSVEHLEDVSTNREFRSQYAKRKMKYRELIRSASVLLKLMNEDEK